MQRINCKFSSNKGAKKYKVNVYIFEEHFTIYNENIQMPCYIWENYEHKIFLMRCIMGSMLFNVLTPSWCTFRLKENYKGSKYKSVENLYHGKSTSIPIENVKYIAHVTRWRGLRNWTLTWKIITCEKWRKCQISFEYVFAYHFEY